MVNTFKPESLDEALEILKMERCTILAGGTDLMVKYRQSQGLEPGFKLPVLFIGGLGEIKKIICEDNILKIGGACTLSHIIESPIVPEYMKPVFLQMASPAIRNAATLGGNICNSSPAGDSLPLLYALDAVLTLKGKDTCREVNIQDFISGPGKNRIEYGEILTEIGIPLKNFNKVEYRKVGTRKSTALSKLSFIGLAGKDTSGVCDIRLAFGAVSPTVVRDRDNEKEIARMLAEEKLDIRLVKEMYSGLIKPIDDQRSTAEYRKKTALRLLEHFLTAI